MSKGATSGILAWAVGICLVVFSPALAEDEDEYALPPETKASPATTADNGAENSATNGTTKPADDNTYQGSQKSASNSAANTAAPEDSATKAEPPDRAERLVMYYLDMYSQHLKNKDWITRTMGIISLAMIDHPRVTQMLLEVVKKDDNSLVRVYAWEALHARKATLEVPQLALWSRLGIDMGNQGQLRGDLRLGYLGLLAKEGPTEKNKKAFLALFANTNSLDPKDIRTLWIMGDILKEWRNPELIKSLISSMGTLDDAYRAELILRRIDCSIPLAGSLKDKGSRAMWTQTQQAWLDWFAAGSYKENKPGESDRYEGFSRMMPPGEKITDATDKKWLKDMELRRFRLDQLDVGFAIDSTGSMGQIIQWIQRDVIKMLRAFQLLSREPRIGVTLYRDIGDKYVVFNVPLTDDTRMLEAALKTADAKGGGDVPEALYDGLHSLLMQKWSGGKSSRKVIMVIGDAPGHEKMQNSLEEMVSNYAKKGFVFFAVKVRTMYASTQDLKNWDPELKSLDTLAEKGGGQSVWIDFGEQALAASGVNTADPSDKETPDRLLFRQVLTAAMEKGYEDRLDPFLNVLMEYVEEPVKEKRVAFPPKPPDTKGDGPHVKKPPVKKFDPQQR